MFFAGKTKRRDSKKKSETGDNQHREQNLLSGGRIVDNQSKWKKLGYKGDAATQGIKKTDTILSSNDLSATRKIGEIRRTSDGDLTRSMSEKTNVLNAVGSRLAEVNGIRKDLVNQEKRRRSSLIDEKDLNLSGRYIFLT